MNFDNVPWATLHGAYRIPYDASAALSKLAEVTTVVDTENIFHELWHQLHHQGDVGPASYYAVPVLVDTCINRQSFDWNYIGLCTLIEHCRLAGHNPPLPAALEQDYFDALLTLERYLLAHFKAINDHTAQRMALALFATLNGQPALGRGIETLDDDVLEELLENYG